MNEILLSDTSYYRVSVTRLLMEINYKYEELVMCSSGNFKSKS